MRKLATLVVFLAITGMTVACQESPLGLPEIASPPAAYSHGCDDGNPDPNGSCDVP